MSKRKIYSVPQVLAGTVFGGPVAAIYMLKKNNDVLENARESANVTVGGGLMTMILILTLPFLPLWAVILVPMVYSGAAFYFARKAQARKKSRRSDNSYEFETPVNVAVVISGALLTLTAAGFVWIAILSTIGLI